MNLIFGGAYQGKLEYGKKAFGYSLEDLFVCDANIPTIDFTKRVIYKTEDFVMACVKNGIEAKEYFREYQEDWMNKVVICTDISQGIVPIEPEFRAWREMTGRLMAYLAEEADTVTRVFCGLPQRLK